MGQLALEAATVDTSILSSIWTFMSGNPIISAMLGIAVAVMGISALMSVFFRSR